MSQSKLRLTAAALAIGLFAAACGSDGANDDAPVSTAADESTDTEEAMDDDDDAMDDDAMDDDAMDDEAMDDDAMDDDEAMDDEAMDDDAMMEDAVEIVVTIENISDFSVTDSGVFAVPVDATEPGPVLPGGAYEFTTYANPGQALSFATMFVQTNDWFFAPNPEGIALYDADDNPISGDITDQVFTFDSGTEVDQEVGAGADQAPRQAGPDTGDADPDATVRAVDGRTAADYVQVTVTPGDNGQFTVRIDNVSEGASTPTPIAPGVYAVHDDRASLFTIGEPDAGLGLEAVAEDGDAAGLAAVLADLTGTPTPLAPGAYAVHMPDFALFELGGTDGGQGLTALAEDGDPSSLAAWLDGAEAVLHSGAFAVPDGAAEPGPLLPGNSYSFTTPIVPGEPLSLATMFVHSNDWIFATPAAGIEVFDANGSLVEGDITDQLLVVDVGTEADETPGFGPNQAPRQAGPDTGDADADTTVRLVDGRTASDYIRVTISAT